MTPPADHPVIPAPKVGVLLTNLGTPDAPDAKSVRRYLAEFLSDPRVIEIPKIAWQPILHGIILRTRGKRAYACQVGPEGSLSPRSPRGRRAVAGARQNGDRRLASLWQSGGRRRSRNVRRRATGPRRALYPQYCAARPLSARRDFARLPPSLETRLPRWPAITYAISTSTRSRPTSTHWRSDFLPSGCGSLPRMPKLTLNWRSYHSIAKTARLLEEMSTDRRAFQSAFGPAMARNRRPTTCSRLIRGRACSECDRRAGLRRRPRDIADWASAGVRSQLPRAAPFRAARRPRSDEGMRCSTGLCRRELPDGGPAAYSKETGRAQARVVVTGGRAARRCDHHRSEGDGHMSRRPMPSRHARAIQRGHRIAPTVPSPPPAVHRRFSNRATLAVDVWSTIPGSPATRR